MTATPTVELPEPLRLLAPDGTLAEGHVPALEGDALLGRLARDAALARVRRALLLAAAPGRLGTFSPVNGEEAAVVGSAWALEPGRDWIVPQYRELPAMLRFGYRLTQAMQYYTGKPAGSRHGRRANVLPFQISLAAQIPHAVGLAWGLRIQGLDAVVCTYFGDGASSEGDAHEALNLAGVRRAPVVFVLKNNGWAISTPVRKQTAAPSFAARAAGLRHRRASWSTATTSSPCTTPARGRRAGAAGEGPTLIEARHLPHGPAQHLRRPDALRRPVELDEHRAFDPDRARAPLPDGGGARRRGLRAGAGRRAARRGRRAFAEAQDSAPPGVRGSSTTSTSARRLASSVSAGRPLMAEMTMIEAIRSTLGAALEADERVIVPRARTSASTAASSRATRACRSASAPSAWSTCRWPRPVIVGSAWAWPAAG
jgi:pyruvate dehydrogenase E1 component alpha subunit